MKIIKFRQDCMFKGEYCFIGDTMTPENMQEVYKLNEKGFIEPLTLKELKIMEKEFEKKEIKINEESN